MFDTEDSADSWSQFAYWSRNAAFEQCPEALMLLDPINNQYIDCNIAACKLLGFDRQEILQLPISAIHSQELAQLVVFTEEVMARGQAWSNLLSCRLKSGVHIPVELSASRVVIKNREYLVVAIKDVSSEERYRDKAEAERIVRGGLLEWKHLESIFQQDERDNLLMLTSVGDGIYCVDTEGLCTFINPAAQRLLGRTGDDVLGQNIHYVHHHTHEDGRHYPVEECPIYAAIRDGVVHEGCQEVFWRHDGTPFPVEFTSTPVISESVIIGAVVVFRDVSERLETEKKLRDALDEVNRLKERLEDENEYLQQEFLIEQNFHGIVGKSDAIRRILQQIDLVSKTEANVLITGESGTGKELIARAIHEASPRKDKPMIRVNCAAIPKELFESEFFGHAKGSFTGALRDRVGRFELADGGTIFLDEVGEIPLEQQSKLLRVLQEGQLERVGEEQTRNVDVRIIAATNRDLKLESEQKNFREDLFFRLNVFPIHSPSLRQRGEDIVLLATHFIDQFSAKFGKSGFALKQSDLKKLQAYFWPGNIRELQNVIERAIITSQNQRLRIDLPLDVVQPDAHTQISEKLEANSDGNIALDEDMQDLVKKNMLAALEKCEWKLFGKNGAAELLGLKPTTLASRIKRLGLKQGK